MIRAGILVPVIFLASATMAQADVVHADDVVINGSGTDDQLCVGDNCVENETFSSNTIKIKIKDDDTGLEFHDINLGDYSWIIETNRNAQNNFRVRNRSTGRTPVTIQGNAPTSSIFVDDDGDIGMGTSLPQGDLHLVDDFQPTILLEQTNTSSPSQSWSLFNRPPYFRISESRNGIGTFLIANGAPGVSLAIGETGALGVGTGVPEGKFHTKGFGVQLAYFESSNGDAVQVRFRSNSENRRFLAVDNADNVKTQMQFKDDAILFLGQTVAQEWLRVDATGITTAGPSCGSPCDLTFDPEAFTVPPIEERAAYMWENMHLPAVGPTAPDRPMNMTEKMGGVIHELEVAHIYIEQLHHELEAQNRRLAQQSAEIIQLETERADHASRLARLEAILSPEED